MIGKATAVIIDGKFYPYIQKPSGIPYYEPLSLLLKATLIVIATLIFVEIRKKKK